MPIRWLTFALATSLLLLASTEGSHGDSVDNPIRVELNTTEPMDGKCRLTFVTSNPAAAAVESLKADTAVFGSDGVVKRRLVIEFGPLRARKTSIRAFDLDASCDTLGSLLINDVIACAPDSSGDCLARLELSSRTLIKLFK